MVQGSPLSKFNVANRLYKQSLLNAVCLVAGVSIFFFGYDQGMMGGVNTNRHYAELMGFGHWDELKKDVVITSTIRQGSIVGVLCFHANRLLRVLTVFASQVAVYYLPGTLFGCFLGGWLGDRYGRIPTIGLGALWSIFGACLQCSAQNMNWMYCG